MNDSFKPALLFGIIGVALATFIGYHNIYHPKQAQVQAVKVQILQENSERQAKVGLDQQLDQVAEYKKWLAPAPEVSWLVKQLVDVARETGVEFDSLIPQNLIRKGDLTTILIRVQFDASYRQLGMIIDHLESNPHFIRIDSLLVNEKASAPVVQFNPHLKQQNTEKDKNTKDDWSVASVDLLISTMYLPPLFPNDDQSEASL